MYREAYNLIREILDDEQLNRYIVEATGKHLSQWRGFLPQVKHWSRNRLPRYVRTSLLGG